MSYKVNILRYIAFMLMLNYYLPIVAENDQLFFLGYRFNLVIWMASLLLFYPRFFLTKSMIFVEAFFAVYLFFGLFGHYDVDLLWFHKNVAPVFLGISIYTFFLWKKDLRGLRLIILISLIFISITSLTNIIGTSIYPYASRLLVTPQGSSSLGLFYQRIGIATYGFVSGLPIIIPPLLYQFANSKNRLRFIWLMITLLITVTIFYSKYTAPIILSSIGLIASLFWRKRLAWNIILIIILFVVAILIPVSFYADLFNQIADVMPSEIVYERIKGIAVLFERNFYFGTNNVYANTEIDYRLDRYPYNFNIFKNHIMIGSGDLGNVHLYWANILARYGLIGFFSLFFVLISQIFLNRNLLDRQEFSYYILSLFLFIGMGLIKAIQGKEMYIFLFLLLPGIFHLKNNQKTRKY